MGDEDRYNPDNYGCRKPVLGFLAVVSAVIAALCIWL